MSDTEKAPRKAPGKMTTFIGQWDDDITLLPTGVLKTFHVMAVLEGAAEKDVKAAVKGLGYGKYDIVTGRCSAIEYKEVVKTAFV